MCFCDFLFQRNINQLEHIEFPGNMSFTYVFEHSTFTDHHAVMRTFKHIIFQDPNTPLNNSREHFSKIFQYYFCLERNTILTEHKQIFQGVPPFQLNLTCFPRRKEVQNSQKTNVQPIFSKVACILLLVFLGLSENCKSLFLLIQCMTESSSFCC